MVLFIGTFPPPIHGMSAINKSVLERLQAEGIAIKKLNIAPKSLKRDILSHLSRIKNIFHAWFYLIFTRKNCSKLYIAISGGWGQVYDIVSIVIARLKGMTCVIHHHNFAYVQEKRFITSFLISVAGKDALHIVLCESLGCLLRKQYGVTEILILSNLTFSYIQMQKHTRNIINSVGFLSNITKEKGGETIIEFARMIKLANIPVCVIVAGPCEEPILASKLQRAMDEGILEWRGPVYGKKKAKFWSDIDVFVFPTINEAEPLVVWESLAAGVPVITYELGCIREQTGSVKTLIPRDEDFIPGALSILEKWITDIDEYQFQIQSAQERYRLKSEDSMKHWREFLEIFS